MFVTDAVMSQGAIDIEKRVAIPMTDSEVNVTFYLAVRKKKPVHPSATKNTQAFLTVRLLRPVSVLPEVSGFPDYSPVLSTTGSTSYPAALN